MTNLVKPVQATIKLPTEMHPLQLAPRSWVLRQPLCDELNGLVAPDHRQDQFYLDTQRQHSNINHDQPNSFHRGLARTHKLSDGSVYFFLTHSMAPMDRASGKGQVMVFRHEGPTEGEHVACPHAIARCEELIEFEDTWIVRDMQFLPDFGHPDSGYLFIQKQVTLSLYYWQLGQRLAFLGDLPAAKGEYVAVDRIDEDYYYLWSGGDVAFRAATNKLFPRHELRSMELKSFENVGSSFGFGVFDRSASQAKFVQDSTNQWWLLGFRSDHPTETDGADYVDVYELTTSPFVIKRLAYRKHVSLPHGATSFANTGTSYVERAGRLLVGSSYRWSKDEGPGDSSYVSRVDESAAP